MDKPHIETVILEVSQSLEVLLDYALDLVEKRHDQGSQIWDNGSDDSFYDYIPNGLEYISKIGELVRLIHEATDLITGDYDSSEKHWQEEMAKICDVLKDSFPFAQDATPPIISDKFLKLAQRIGVTREWLIQNWYIDDDELEGLSNGRE